MTLGDDAVNESKDIISTWATTLGVLSDFEHKLASGTWFSRLFKVDFRIFKLLPLNMWTSTRIPLRLLQASGRSVSLPLCYL